MTQEQRDKLLMITAKMASTALICIVTQNAVHWPKVLEAHGFLRRYLKIGKHSSFYECAVPLLEEFETLLKEVLPLDERPVTGIADGR